MDTQAKPIRDAAATTVTASSMMRVAPRSVGLQNGVRWKPIFIALVDSSTTLQRGEVDSAHAPRVSRSAVHRPSRRRLDRDPIARLSSLDRGEPTVDMNCPECGQVNPADARFCNSCGSRLLLTCPACQQPNAPAS